MNVRPHSAHTPPANPCGQLVPLCLTVAAAAARLRLYRDEFPHPFLRARRRFFGPGGATTATAGDWSIAPAVNRCVSGSTTCRRNDPPSLLGTRLLCRSSRSRQLLRDPARRHGHARTACRGCEERRGGPARPRPRRASPRSRSAPACSLPSLRSPPHPWSCCGVLLKRSEIA